MQLPRRIAAGFRSTTMAMLVLVSTIICAEACAEVVETRTLTDRIELGDTAAFEVVVDNVFGPIRVIGHDRPVVEMTATETVRGDTQTDVDRARAEVALRTVREDGRIAFLVRGGSEDCACRCGCRWDGYVVAYDIELRVPRDVAIDVSTVNQGEIVVDGVRGRFRATNVNGPVTLRGLREAGRASTVNGKVLASFERSPADAVSFETVNGEIEAFFPDDLSAELRFKTMRGEIWTDFEAAPVSVVPVREQVPGRGNVIRADRYTAVRVASGGPEYSFETLNGDIYVRRSR